MSLCGYVYTCMCTAMMKYFKDKYIISFNNVMHRYKNMIVGFVVGMQY